MIADYFTKPLQGYLLQRFQDLIMNLNPLRKCHSGYRSVLRNKYKPSRGTTGLLGTSKTEIRTTIATSISKNILTIMPGVQNGNNNVNHVVEEVLSGTYPLMYAEATHRTSLTKKLLDMFRMLTFNNDNKFVFSLSINYRTLLVINQKRLSPMASQDA
jgi:hypothetical protein